VAYNGLALRGYCAIILGHHRCEFGVAHDPDPSATKVRHNCIRTTEYATRDRAWFWDLYNPPRPAATAELATLAECIAKAESGEPVEPSKGSISLTRNGSFVSLYGFAPGNAGLAAERLTVRLPKGMKFVVKRPCSEGFARSMTLDNNERCGQVMGGRLRDTRLRAWFAFAGPKQSGGRRRLWLRARHDDDLVGFGTGTIFPASGGYGQKLVVQLGPLGLEASAIELSAPRLRATKSCSKKRRYRLELVTDAGTAKGSGMVRCGGGGGGGPR
jgi:hypothetical protein